VAKGFSGFLASVPQFPFRPVFPGSNKFGVSKAPPILVSFSNGVPTSVRAGPKVLKAAIFKSVKPSVSMRGLWK
jgi:hypothetical protein